MQTSADPVIWDKTREDFERTFYLSRFGNPTTTELARGYRALLRERNLVSVRDPYCKTPRWAMEWDPPGRRHHGFTRETKATTQRKAPMGTSQGKPRNARASLAQGR